MNAEQIDMITLKELEHRILSGNSISFDEAMALYDMPLEDLKKAADEIRDHFCHDHFDTCGVISVKGGRCSEDCRFCPQSIVSHASAKQFALLPKDEIIRQAQALDDLGVSHVCLVSSGRRLSKPDISRLCESIAQIRSAMQILPCASLGLIDAEDCRVLKEAGLVRLHNNLESSEAHFKTVCTSHLYQEKLSLLKAAKDAGLELCSGGLIGIGESRADRIRMALTLQQFQPESIPINLLYPSVGSAMEHMAPLPYEEILRTFAVFRFLFPKSEIRLAAGRDLLSDTGLECFVSGSNAAITGDCLTVKGISAKEDKEQIRTLILQDWHSEKTRP